MLIMRPVTVPRVSIFRASRAPSPRNMVTYANSLCLAPMVRSGELPTRIMALQHGAHLVWSPEIVDKKLMRTTRQENDQLKSVDFVEDGEGKKNSNKVVFRTVPALEKGKLIFQLGSSNPDFAVEAALKVVKDVDGIDLNCGCPKPFSTHSGMGAALLSTPDLLVSILENLVQKVGLVHKIPISCKIRLLDPEDPQPTLDLVERVCKTGIANITIHCRTRIMRNREAPLHAFLPKIIDAIQAQGVSVIINGAIQTKKDFLNLQRRLDNHTIGGMIAEAAETNPSVFSDLPLTWANNLHEFISTCIKYDNHPVNTKYILLNQVPGKSRFYKEFCKAKTHEEFLAIADRMVLLQALGELDDKSFSNKIYLKYLSKDQLVSPEEYDHLFDYDSQPAVKKKEEEKKRKLEIPAVESVDSKKLKPVAV